MLTASKDTGKFERNTDMNRVDMDLELNGLDKWHDGNMYFLYEHATVDIASQINSMNSFEEFDKFYTDELIDGNALLAEYLSKLLEEHNAKAEVVSLEIGYSHDYVRKIATGERKDPRRDVLLAICTYIHATVEETQALLRYAGQQPLYARRRRDAIIWFALKKKQPFKELNEFLYEKKYTTLWKR